MTNVSCTSTGAVVFYTSTATGGCSPVNVVCRPPSGSTFPIGTTSVTCTATDACTNSTTCSFSVTVTRSSCPLIQLSCSPSIMTNVSCTSTGAVVFYTSTATGGCSPVNVVCKPGR